MKITTKTKVLFVVIPILVLMGIFLLQKEGAKKYLDHGKPLPPSPSLNVGERKTAQNKCSIRNEDLKVESVEHIKKIPSQISLSETKQKEESEFEDKFSELELPSPFEDNEIERIIEYVQINRVWKAQDRIINTWPAYSEVQKKLLKELSEKLDIDKLSTEQIIQIALEFRKGFWQEDGCFSRNSYQNAYKGRILLEYVHERNPDNMMIIDELVETIQTTHPFIVFSKKTNELIRNKDVEKILLHFRSKQFEQVKKNVQQGSDPTWQDFVCACDLSILLSGRDNSLAKEIIEWQLAEADRGGWTGYTEFLETFLHRLNQDKGYNYGIYVVDNARFPEEYRYGRRLPSFRGPNARGAHRWR